MVCTCGNKEISLPMAEKHEFKTEVRKTLDLVINSLYSNKEIFLRELISNASDAIDRARFESLKDSSLLEDNADWKIKLSVDREKGTLTVSDNGIGMTAEEVENNIGTVASSGTRHFLEEYADKKEQLPPELIGQFGVGFYSAFMVADEVTVITRPHGAPGCATKWTSNGDGFYTIEPAVKATRGTDIIMHLKESDTEFLDEWKLRGIVKKYSDFVEHPIVMDVTHEEPVKDADGKPVLGEDGKPVPPEVTVVEETLNSQKALWLRAKNEITKEEYEEFYKHLSRDFQPPFETIHWSVEGQTEFKALIYIPQKPMWEMLVQDQRPHGLQLYVRRVFITDNCEELLPRYLRFLRGVVDSADLPLNVSREMLQEDRSLRLIRKNIVKKVLDTLESIRTGAPERYESFFSSFGAILKEGLREDFENREKIQNLLLFASSALESGKRTTLADYAKRMPEGQKEIYYLLSDSVVNAANAPQLEAFRKKGYEVLFMTDPVDEFVIPSVGSFQDKQLRDISKGEVDLETEEEKKAREENLKANENGNNTLIARLKDLLKNKVQDVRLSNRLTDSACCLVEPEWGMSQQMQRLMKAMKQEVPDVKPILEINPSHPLIAAMRGICEKDATSARITDCAELLLDQARLMANQPIDNPLEFARKVSQLMADSLEAKA